MLTFVRTRPLAYGPNTERLRFGLGSCSQRPRNIVTSLAPSGWFHSETTFPIGTVRPYADLDSPASKLRCGLNHGDLQF